MGSALRWLSQHKAILIFMSFGRGADGWRWAVTFRTSTASTLGLGKIAGLLGMSQGFATDRGIVDRNVPLYRMVAWVRTLRPLSVSAWLVCAEGHAHKSRQDLCFVSPLVFFPAAYGGLTF